MANTQHYSMKSILKFLGVLAIGAAIGFLCSPEIRTKLFASAKHSDEEHEADADHDHEKAEAGHAEDAADKHEDEDGHAETAATPDHKHAEEQALALNERARANIGIRLRKISLESFEKTVQVPSMIIERPGCTTLEVTAPMTGVVETVFAIQGEAVQPGQPLFEVRLTHEDLLQKQTEFLRSLEELDVLDREVKRLEAVAAEGAIAGKTLLERKYEQQKSQASLRADRQALLLHGISEDQIADIEKNRTLLKTLVLRAPNESASCSKSKSGVWWQIRDLKVSTGSYVTAGTTLCKLTDHSELFLEGKAFEQDIPAINRAAANKAKVSAALGLDSQEKRKTFSDLSILYLDDKIDPESRTYRFYVTLPNRIAREDVTPEGRHFVYWEFKPGERVKIRVPVEKWDERIVLPAEAVAEDGAEFFVFEANGEHFDRRSVRVEYRDNDSVVIANDGALKIGATIAESAAHQLQTAMKNKQGGPVDPHAGHNH